MAADRALFLILLLLLIYTQDRSGGMAVPLRHPRSSSDSDTSSPPSKKQRDGVQMVEEVHRTPSSSISLNGQTQGGQTSEGRDEETRPMVGVQTSGASDERDRRCFFNPPDQHKSIHETKERIDVSRNGQCDGPLVPMRPLMEEDERRIAELFGAEHRLDLILTRGTGEHKINWNDEVVRDFYSQQYICQNHSKYLGYDYNYWTSTHVKRLYNKKIRKYEGFQCTIGSELGIEPFHEQPVKGPRTLSKENTEALLRVHGFLVFPGAYVCRAHREYADKLVAQKAECSASPSGASDGSYISNPPSRQSSRASSPSNEYTPAAPFQRSAIRETHQALGISDDMIERLKDFGTSIGETKVTGRIHFLDLGHDTKRKKVVTGRRLLSVMTRIMAPDASTQFLDRVCKRDATEAETKLQKLIEDLVFNYRAATGKQSRRMWLSLIAKQLPYGLAAQYIPGLTHYAYYDAKRHYRLQNLPPVPVGKQRYQIDKVEFFVDYITSPFVTVGLPYGVVTTRRSDGTKVEIPSTLRQMTDGEVIENYGKYLEESGNIDMAMGHTSYRGILSVLNANTRATLFCVDNMVAAAEDGFDRMLSVLQQMQTRNIIDETKSSEMRTKLYEVRGYLRTDYKMHVKPESKIPTHCINYALSDRSDSNFREEQSDRTMTHKHEYSCSLCQLMDTTLAEIATIFDDWFIDVSTQAEDAKRGADEVEKSRLSALLDEVSDLRNDFLEDERSINELRRHQLRTAHSEQTRVMIVDDLQQGTALVTADFAQKLLPQKYREAQKDYYGKRGMSWHISHVLTRNNNKRLVQQVVIHIFDTEAQDAGMVTSIFDHLFGLLKTVGLDRIILRSDNAACYKSQRTIMTLPSLATKNNVRLLRYSFSEVQAGKSAADRAAAKVKTHLRKYLRKGNSIMTPDDFMRAVKSGPRPLRGMTFVRAIVRRAAPATAPTKTINIQGIRQLGDFDFETLTTVRVRRYARIGPGQVIETSGWTSAASQDTLDAQEVYRPPTSIANFLSSAGAEVVNEPTNEPDTSANTCSDDDDNDVQSSATTPAPIPGAAHRCPEEGCIKTFASYGNLVRHVMEGKHSYRPNHISLRDYSINAFSQNMEHLDEQRFVPLKDGLKECVQLEKMPEEGWALPEKRSVERFTADTIAFLIELYDEGATGKKVTPHQAVKRMKDARTAEQKKRFTRILHPDQIMAFFSRYGQKQRLLAQPRTRRAVAEEDLGAWEAEMNAFEGDYNDELDAWHEDRFERAMNVLRSNDEVTLADKV